MADTSHDQPDLIPADAQLHDALDDWVTQANGTVAQPLTSIRLDANERLVIPFTTQVLTVTLHYLEAPALSGYVHCLGHGCVLCRAGKNPDQRDLLPVFDVEEQQVGVLAVPPNLRPQALKPQLMPALRQLKEGKRLLLMISRPDRARVQVSIQSLTDDLDDGADVIQRFRDQLEAGAVDLASVFPRLSNEELAGIPKVANALKAKGIKLP
jgi:hypothetical protein